MYIDYQQVTDNKKRPFLAVQIVNFGVKVS